MIDYYKPQPDAKENKSKKLGSSMNITIKQFSADT